MKFKEIKKHKNYKSWVWRDKRVSCVAYINLMPETKLIQEYYHFKVNCNKRYCKKPKCDFETCTYKLDYSSLSDGKTFETFDDCHFGVELWFSSNDLYCPMW